MARFKHLRQTLNKLFSPNLEKALTFLNDSLLPTTSNAVVEGLNGKAKVTTRNAYGFKTFTTLELALYHNLGALPEPISTHRFF